MFAIRNTDDLFDRYTYPNPPYWREAWDEAIRKRKIQGTSPALPGLPPSPPAPVSAPAKPKETYYLLAAYSGGYTEILTVDSGKLRVFPNQADAEAEATRRVKLDESVAYTVVRAISKVFIRPTNPEIKEI